MLMDDSTDDVVCFTVVDMNDLIREVIFKLRTNGIDHSKQFVPIELRLFTRLSAVFFVLRKGFSPPRVLTVGADNDLTELFMKLFSV
jgi:hypothetical protein